MKINDKENINEITLRHKGKNIKFECFVKPFPYAERLDLEKRNSAEIVFNDLINIFTTHTNCTPWNHFTISMFT